jgi:DNA-binding transcriptional regulator/RsmH inhibitor MraZ
LEREVVVAGAYNRFEIWDARRYRELDAEGAASIQEGEGLDEFM